MRISPGRRFRDAMRTEKPLQIVGAINAKHALMAQIQSQPGKKISCKAATDNIGRIT